MSENYSEPKNRASAFADWVFRKNNPWYVPGKGRIGDRRFGEYAHAAIEDLFLWLSPNHEYDQNIWKPIYIDKDGKAQENKIASKLRVENLPLKCRPDVVLEDSKTAKIIIVERKTHRVRDQRGWRKASYQNIWAQLWCYGYIDEWVGRSQILLISELWNFRRGSFTPVPNREKRTLKDIDREIIPLFFEYGGEILNDL